ncbi:MAG: ribonuclease E/G, partial [Pseudomonadota bacterium]
PDFNCTVGLKSGGYIVIGVTEALVAIDVNSGKATKKGSIEETALETNLEAAEEIARQLRLRDLAGLIVIDFIDMEERKNNSAVEKRFKDKLKTDRARIQVGRISAFGLMEMSRQRLRPGMLEATTQPCPHCHGTGLLRSDDSLGLTILRQLEEEGTRKRSREVLVKAPIGIVNFLVNGKREHIAGIEARYGLSVRIEADPMLISPDYTIEKFKTATRVIERMSPVVSVDASLMGDIEEADEAPMDGVEEASEDQPPKKKRRRRRRRRGGGGGGDAQTAEANSEAGAEASDGDASPVEADASTDAPEAEANPEASDDAPKPKRRRRSRKKTPIADDATPVEAAEGASEDGPAEAPAEASADEAADPPAKPRRSRTRRKKTDAPTADVSEAAGEPATASNWAPEPTAEPAPAPAPQPVPEPTPEPVTAEDAPPEPKRRGWWLGGG